MGDFFSKVKEGFNKTTNYVSVKSSTLVESNKIKSEISQAGRQKKEIFSEIGEAVYEMKKAGNIEVMSLEEKLAAIFALDDRMVELNQQLEEVAKKEEEALKKSEEARKPKVCAGCASPLSPGAKFCLNCGKPVEEEKEVEIKNEQVAETNSDRTDETIE